MNVSGIRTVRTRDRLVKSRSDKSVINTHAAAATQVGATLRSMRAHKWVYAQLAGIPHMCVVRSNNRHHEEHLETDLRETIASCKMSEDCASCTRPPCPRGRGTHPVHGTSVLCGAQVRSRCCLGAYMWIWSESIASSSRAAVVVLTRCAARARTPASRLWAGSRRETTQPRWSAPRAGLLDADVGRAWGSGKQHGRAGPCLPFGVGM